MPQWLPKTRLYVGLERWGIEGAASVIEARVLELGGLPKQESIQERAARFTRAKLLTEMQKNFQRSENGVRAASIAYEEFSSVIETSAAVMRDVGIRLTTKRSNEFRIVSGIAPINLIADFRPTYANVLDGAHLTLAYFKGFPQMPGFHGSYDAATRLRRLRYSFEMIGLDRFAYVGLDERRREFTPAQLADHALQEYLNVAEKNPLKY